MWSKAKFRVEVSINKEEKSFISFLQTIAFLKRRSLLCNTRGSRGTWVGLGQTMMEQRHLLVRVSLVSKLNQFVSRTQFLMNIWKCWWDSTMVRCRILPTGRYIWKTWGTSNYSFPNSSIGSLYSQTKLLARIWLCLQPGSKVPADPQFYHLRQQHWMNTCIQKTVETKDHKHLYLNTLEPRCSSLCTLQVAEYRVWTHLVWMSQESSIYLF